jgi:hypothetical protein
LALFGFGEKVRRAIAGTGSYGIDINAKGSAAFKNLTVTKTAKAALNNPGGYTLVRGAGNSGF